MDTGSQESATQREHLPKLCGADIEVGNFILGSNRQGGTGGEAARALLREIEGVPRDERKTAGHTRDYDSHYGGSDYSYGRYYGGSYGYDSQDWGRKFLKSNGGCVYIDLDHLELCLPEVVSAHDWVACWHAMLRIARRAMMDANEGLGDGRKIQVLINNSDGLGHSYGSHLDFLVTRRAWDNLFHRKLHQLLYLASFQVSSIVFTGQGKVGAENGTPAVGFQLSQRADFFETLTGSQTTSNRPIVNSRDEALCGRSRSEESGMARLHCIFYDSNLCHAANLLKIGSMQIMLAMIEAERINPSLILDDPVEAVVCWSHDPSLKATARMASGQELTAVEAQLLFLEEAKRFCEEGGCEGIVPRADDILALWEDTLLKLKDGNLSALSSRLDWVLKLSVLQQVIGQHPELDWESPAVKQLDHLYSSLDPSEGLYWAYERSGLVEAHATEAEIARFAENPPDDTRAYARAMLLRRAGAGGVDSIDWDSIRFKRKGKKKYYWPTYRTLDLSNPLAFSRAHTEALFADGASLDDILDTLGSRESDSYSNWSWKSAVGSVSTNGGNDNET